MLTATNLSSFKKALAVATAVASPNKSAAFGGVVQVQSNPLGLEDTTPKGYRIVGTDGNVLTVATVDNMAGFGEFKFLLNLAAASVVQLVDGETVFIGESDKQVWFKSGGTTVFASKPVQTYPNFDSILSVVPKLKFSFKPEEWLAALRTVEPLIDESVDRGAIALHLANNVVSFKSIGIGSTAADESEYEQVLPEPDPFTDLVSVVGLRVVSKYLSGFLSKSTGEAFLNLTDKDKPVKLESGNVMTLMMPLMSKKETK
jgi:DNA polymerase III sliding clamp (beta) subunit (PCNA family)